MSTTTDTYERTRDALAMLLSEITVWDVPQYCECGSFCDQTVLGEAFNTARDANILFESAGKDVFYGGTCELLD